MKSHLLLADGAGLGVSGGNYSKDGDWAARVLTSDGPNSFGHAGWEWFAAHDGQGSSLELINPALPNGYALNWGSSAVPGGTPGEPNSILASNAAPIIASVSHAPAL